jgi:hypothetical protein
VPTVKVNRAASGSCLTIMAGERSLRNSETKPNSNLSIDSHPIRSLLAHLSRKFRIEFLHVARNDAGLPIVEPISEVQTFAWLSQ